MKDNRPKTINLTPKTEAFLEKERERLNVSPSRYVNDLLLLAMRIQKDVNNCPQSYLALNVDESEVSPVLNGIL